MSNTLGSSSARKDIPLARGVLDYFPAALAAVAELSQRGNDKHNPGEDLHWARGKSMDHADCILRHLADRGTIDPEDGLSHTVKVAWRALALLQEELEAAGASMPRGARVAPATEGKLGNLGKLGGCTNLGRDTTSTAHPSTDFKLIWGCTCPRCLDGYGAPYPFSPPGYAATKAREIL